MKTFTFTIFMIFLSFVVVGKKNKIPLIGEKAPSFTENSTNGMLNFPEDFGQSWKILFSHPLDFTAVCTSELCGLAQYQERFDSLNVKIAVVSIDEIDRHLLWKEFMEKSFKENGQNLKIEYPIIADLSEKVSKKYGMLHTINSERDVRGVYIIDSDNIVQAISFYPTNIGRNIDEMLRTVAALQLAQNENVLTPANWNPGDDVLVPHKPYTAEELEANPALKDQYYNVGEYMWFKKVKK